MTWLEKTSGKTSFIALSGSVLLMFISIIALNGYGIICCLYAELFKDRMEDLKDPLFLLFWSGQKDWHIHLWSGTLECGVEDF